MSRHIGGMSVTKLMENLIKTKVKMLDTPYRFKIKGTPGGGYNSEESALKAFEKLEKWAKQNHAEIELLENNYTWEGKKRYEYLLVKITDPIAFPIERILEGF